MKTNPNDNCTNETCATNDNLDSNNNNMVETDNAEHPNDYVPNNYEFKPIENDDDSSSESDDNNEDVEDNIVVRGENNEEYEFVAQEDSEEDSSSGNNTDDEESEEDEQINWRKSVDSFYDPVDELPTNPNVGDRYISYDTANGWTKNYIYEYVNSSTWKETVPVKGDATYVIGGEIKPHMTIMYNGDKWGKMRDADEEERVRECHLTTILFIAGWIGFGIGSLIAVIHQNLTF